MKTTKRFALLIAICMMASTIFSHEVYASDVDYETRECIIKELQADPTLTSIYGHTVKISENRTLVVDGEDTERNVDSCDSYRHWYTLPTEDGTFFGSSFNNHIYYVPSWYTGPTTYYETEYVNKDGYQNVSYEVPLVSSWEEVKEYHEEHSEDSWKSIYLSNVDGEEIKCYAPCHTEFVFGFSFKRFGETVERVYDLGIENSKNYEEIHFLAYDNNRLLITLEDALFGVYDFGTNEFEIITDSAIDYYLVGNELLFTDYNHNEHSCKWVETSTATLTGNQLVHYHNYDLVLKDEYQQEYFKKVQEEVRSNENAKNNYDIDSYNDLYLDGELIGDINLPSAMEYNADLMCSDGIKGIWLIEDGFLKLYRYGKVICQYQLPGDNPKWSIISGYRDSDTNKIYMLLFNEGVIYILEDGGKLLKVAEDVVDYLMGYAYGNSYLCWMDSNGNGYGCSNIWKYESGEHIHSLNNVVGVAWIGEEPGFILNPTDERGVFLGGHRYTNYYCDD